MRWARKRIGTVAARACLLIAAAGLLAGSASAESIELHVTVAHVSEAGTGIEDSAAAREADAIIGKLG